MHGRSLKQLFRRAAVVVLALLCLCAPFGRALDLSMPCSITVNAGENLSEEERQQAELVVDIYQIAEAEASGAAGYRFTLHAPYASLELTDEMSEEAWRSLEQSALPIAVHRDTPVIAAGKIGERLTERDDGEALGCGLYLLVVRGAKLTNYLEGNATVADSADDRLRFQPRIVALPYDIRDAAGQPTGELTYDLIVSMKMERSPMNGAIEIVKTLLSYRTGEPAMFVFSVRAVLGGMTVYDDVHTLQFTKAGTARLRIGDLPAGAVVTVTELYSGACYTLITEPTKTGVVTASETLSLEFTNDYDETATGGHGIDNEFTYHGGSGWTLTPVGGDRGVAP